MRVGPTKLTVHVRSPTGPERTVFAFISPRTALRQKLLNREQLCFSPAGSQQVCAHAGGGASERRSHYTRSQEQQSAALEDLTLLPVLHDPQLASQLAMF
jgi:hypothetical protein